jgi:predicted alpha/beta superfamily hydrolase
MAPKLQRVNDTTFAISLVFDKPDALQFKFTKGSWANEALNDDGTVPGNTNLKLLRDTAVTFTVNKWGSQQQRSVFKGKVTGEVKYHRAMQGDSILPRDIVVWLPPDYDKNRAERYPVIYAHDGQNLFDPSTSSFGVDWQLDETADSLIRADKIKRVIIVGIYCTEDRSADYSYGQKGEAYMNFIVNKLKPFIDSTYRTLPDRNNTITWGSSMGGLISLMLVWQHSDVFSKAACFSPAFKIDELDYTGYLKSYKGPKKDIKLYIDDGGIDLEERLLPGIKETLKLLDSMGYKEGKDITFFEDKKAEHNEAAWAKRAYMPLELFLGR